MGPRVPVPGPLHVCRSQAHQHESLCLWLRNSQLHLDHPILPHAWSMLGSGWGHAHSACAHGRGGGMGQEVTCVHIRPCRPSRRFITWLLGGLRQLEQRPRRDPLLQSRGGEAAGCPAPATAQTPRRHLKTGRGWSPHTCARRSTPRGREQGTLPLDRPTLCPPAELTWQEAPSSSGQRGSLKSVATRCFLSRPCAGAAGAVWRGERPRAARLAPGRVGSSHSRPYVPSRPPKGPKAPECGLWPTWCLLSH